jgi:hypothetical protein
MGVPRALVVALALLAVFATEAQGALRANVRWEKSGGFAGVVQKVTIRPNGTGVATNEDRRRSFRLSSAVRRTLERAVVAADLGHTRDPKPGNGADQFQYSVSYGPHKVTWDDLGANPPVRVRRLAVLLEELYERYAPAR